MAYSQENRWASPQTGRRHCSVKAPVEGEYAAKKREELELGTPLLSINFQAVVLSHIFSDITANPGYMRIWPDEHENIELVDNKYGPVPKGSVLSYQQCKILALDPTIHVPGFKLPTPSCSSIVLNGRREQLFYESLSLTNEEALKYE